MAEAAPESSQEANGINNTEPARAAARASNARSAFSYSLSTAEPIEVSLVVLPPSSSNQSGRLHMSFSADHMVLSIYGISLLGLFILYRRETDTLTKLRFAAAGGLVSVIFLCTSVALPWTQAPPDLNVFNLCELGHEAYCVSANALGAGAADFSATLEQTQWAAAGIRAGQASLLLMFLPACLWLLVAPGSRGAQALVCGSSVPGVFLGISTVLFLRALKSEVVRPRGAADIALLTSLTVVVVAISIIVTARRSRATRESIVVPSAIAKQSAKQRC